MTSHCGDPGSRRKSHIGIDEIIPPACYLPHCNSVILFEWLWSNASIVARTHKPEPCRIKGTSPSATLNVAETCRICRDSLADRLLYAYQPVTSRSEVWIRSPKPHLTEGGNRKGNTSIELPLWGLLPLSDSGHRIEPVKLGRGCSALPADRHTRRKQDEQSNLQRSGSHRTLLRLSWITTLWILDLYKLIFAVGNVVCAKGCWYSLLWRGKHSPAQSLAKLPRRNS